MNHTTMLANLVRKLVNIAAGLATADPALPRGSPWAVREIRTTGYPTAVVASANDQRVAVRRSVSQPKTTRGRTR
jgi:hypothetical protein